MQYTVKSGDRLSEIARQLGVKTSDISGYKSGDPNLIYAGEVLNVGGRSATPSNYLTDVLGSGLLKSSKTLNPTITAPKSAPKTAAPTYTPQQSAAPTPIATTPAPTVNTPTDDYRKGMDEEYSTDEYDTKRQKAFEDMQGLREKTYNDAYKSKGLAKVKDEIASVDDEITRIRQARDESVLKTQQNPYLSASALTGDVSKLTDKYNADINTLIAKRNALAGDYNSSLAEIDKEVENQYSDKKLELEYYGGLSSDRQKALSEALKTTADEEKLDKQLENALMIANIRAADTGSGTNLQLITDPYGTPLYWADKKGGTIINIDDGQDLGGGESYAQALLKQAQQQNQEEDDTKWWNPLTWF